MVTGRGFIALCLPSSLAAGQPLGVFLATLLFGFVDALQLRLQVLPQLPYQLLAVLPYLCTFAALVFMRQKGPRPQGQRPALRPGGLLIPSHQGCVSPTT